MAKHSKIDIPLGPDISNQETQDLPPITEEVLNVFAEKKPEVEAKHINLDKEDKESKKQESEIKTDRPHVNEKKKQKKTKKARPNVKNQKPKKKKNKKKKIRSKHKFLLLKITLWLMLILLFLVLAFSVWNRWFRYNDEQQIIGEWQLAGTSSVCTIDQKNIILGKNAVLEYKIDVAAKLIYYKLGNMEGCSHYRFSADRKQLAFVEEGSKDGFSTVIDDFNWFCNYCECASKGIDLSPAYTQKANSENTSQNIENIKNGSNHNFLLIRNSNSSPVSQ